MKVAIVMPHGKVAGAERVLCELLAATEPGTVVVCLPEGSVLAERVVALGHRVRHFRLPKLSGPVSALSYPWRYLRACRDLRAVVREEDVTVLHSFVAFTIKAVAPVALLTRTPALLSVHEITTRAAIGGLKSRLQRWLAVAAFCRITAVSRYVAEGLIAEGYPAERIAVVHNGIDRLSAPSGRADARAALDLPADALVVLVIGRLTRWKGQDVAIAAFERFCAGWPGAEARLAVVGGPFEPEDAAFEAELHRSVAAGPLADRVMFFGQRREAEVFYDAADVVLVPSLEPDPFPTVVLEAGLSGRCVVASHLGGAREAVVEGVTGLICAPTPQAMADALTRAADLHWRTQVEGKAQGHIEQEFSRARFARAIHEQWASTEAGGTRTRTPRLKASRRARAAASPEWWASTEARPAPPRATRRSGSRRTSTSAVGNSDRPAVTTPPPSPSTMPSTPHGVVTTGNPCAMASRTLTLGPEDGGHGKATTAASDRMSALSENSPMSSTPGTWPTRTVSRQRPARSSRACGSASCTVGHASSRCRSARTLGGHDQSASMAATGASTGGRGQDGAG